MAEHSQVDRNSRAFRSYSGRDMPKRDTRPLTREGRFVEAARLAAGKSKAELAVALNISEKTLRRAMTGDNRMFRSLEVARIYEVTDAPPGFLESGFAALGVPATDGATPMELLAMLADQIAANAAALHHAVAFLREREAAGDPQAGDGQL